MLPYNSSAPPPALNSARMLGGMAHCRVLTLCSQEPSEPRREGVSLGEVPCLPNPLSYNHTYENVSSTKARISVLFTAVTPGFKQGIE